MPEPESLNTMFQASFVDVGGGNYALATAGAASEAPGDTSPGSGPIAESGLGSGSEVAPIAGQTIATHQPPASAAGFLHKIDITTWFSATAPTGVDNFNMAFKYGDTVISPVPAIPDLHIPITTTLYFKAANGVAFSVVAIDAGTAAVEYNAMIVSTRVVS